MTVCASSHLTPPLCRWELRQAAGHGAAPRHTGAALRHSCQWKTRNQNLAAFSGGYTDAQQERAAHAQFGGQRRVFFLVWAAARGREAGHGGHNEGPSSLLSGTRSTAGDERYAVRGRCASSAHLRLESRNATGTGSVRTRDISLGGAPLCLPWGTAAGDRSMRSQSRSDHFSIWLRLRKILLGHVPPPKMQTATAGRRVCRGMHHLPDAPLTHNRREDDQISLSTSLQPPAWGM